MKILFADNDREFLETRVEFLRQARYQVITSTSPQETVKILANDHVDLAIIDIRLVNEDDEKDRSGLMIARNRDFQHIPKIMLTGFPSFNQVREALGPALDGLPPAVDFISKQEGPDALLEAVNRAIHNYVHINEDLIISSNRAYGALGLRELALELERDLAGEQLAARAGELGDLLRSMFIGYKQVTLQRPLWQRERQGVLELSAYKETTEEEKVLLCCARPGSASDWKTIYHEWVPRVFGQPTSVIAKTTSHYSGAAWVVFDRDPESLVTLAEKYPSLAAEDAGRLLSSLCTSARRAISKFGLRSEKGKSLPNLYSANLGVPDPMSLATIVAQTIEAVREQALAHPGIEVKLEGQSLSIHMSDHPAIVVDHAARFLRHPGLFPSTNALSRMQFGTLDVDTILVDGSGHTWPCDFSHTGYAPPLNDLAALEVSLRFELIDYADLAAFYEFEKRLLAFQKLGEPIGINAENRELRKALASIHTIRLAAAREGDTDPVPYLIGLFYHTIEGLKEAPPDARLGRDATLKLLRRIIFAGLVGQRLNELRVSALAEPVPPETEGLYIDPEIRQAYLDATRLDLTPTEYDLLLYLYDRAGTTCLREDIGRDVFNLVEPAPYEIDSFLNTNISRLRDKIEQNSEALPYIHTMRGRGYMLTRLPQ